MRLRKGIYLVLLIALLLSACGGRETPRESEQTEGPAPTQTEPTLPPPENPYGPNDFQYADGFLACIAGPSTVGIDVSDHQGTVDWASVRASGVEFVMIRIGYRGYETGQLWEDAMAQENYRGAREAGLQIGAYFFSQAVSREEAEEEAAFALDAIKDWTLDMPLAYDWEYIAQEARTGDMDSRTLTDCTAAFCGAVEAAGYKPMIYFNRFQAEQLLLLPELKEYPFWLAMYSDRMTYPYRLSMWQYTNTGHVPGIETDVDIDLYFP